MTRDRTYVHDETTGAPIDATGELLALDTHDRDRISVSIEADVASDFALDVKFSESGSFVERKAYASTDSVADTVDAAVWAVRIRNTTAQTSGDTADVRLGAA